MRRYAALMIFLSVFCSFSENIIAVLPFKGEGTGSETAEKGLHIAEHLSSFFGQADFLSVVERTQMEKVAGEIALGQSGLIDESKAVEAGKMAGATLIVVGSFEKKGATLKVQGRLVDVKNGMVRGSTIQEGINETDVLNLTAIKLMEAIDVRVSHNRTYKTRKAIAFSSLGAAAVLAGLTVWSHTRFLNADETYRTSVDLSAEEFKNQYDQASLHNNLRYYMGGGAAAFLTAGVFLILTNRTEWEFERRDRAVTVSPVLLAGGAGIELRGRF